MKAFPTIELFKKTFDEKNNHSGYVTYGNRGMDLRDYFAAKAMQGAISNPNFDNKKGNKDFPKDCYALADAMMEARK